MQTAMRKIKKKALRLQHKQNWQLQKLLSRLETKALAKALEEKERSMLSKFYLTAVDEANSMCFEELVERALSESTFRRFVRCIEGFYDIRAVKEEIKKIDQEMKQETKEGKQ